jgi:DNA-binding Lrp family transcriptional regulator
MQPSSRAAFDTIQRKILQMVQDDLPDSPVPFAVIAESLGVDEQYVLDFLRSLAEDGSIRRFGATLRHQEAGYGCNVMVAWRVDRDMERISRIMTARPEITHCYQRASCPEWPFNLYTMVHGKSSEDCQRVVQELREATGIESFEMLYSEDELKKTSMRYF